MAEDNSNNFDVSLTHVSNINRLVLANSLCDSYSNNLSNKKSLSAKSGKTSSFEAGNSALSCLLIVMSLETSINSLNFLYKHNVGCVKKCFNINIKKLLTKNLDGRGIVVDDIFDDFLEILNDIYLIRNVIAHGYRFDGTILYDEDYEISEMKIRPIVGDKVNKIIDNRTSKLKINVSPYSISIYDSIIVYIVSEYCRLMLGLSSLANTLIRDINGNGYVHLWRWCDNVMKSAPEGYKSTYHCYKNKYYEDQAKIIGLI